MDNSKVKGRKRGHSESKSVQNAKEKPSLRETITLIEENILQMFYTFLIKMWIQ